MISTTDLLKLKKKIEDNKAKRAELQGRQKQLYAQLKEQFDVSTLKEADEMLENLRTKEEQLKQSLETLENQLKDEFNF